VLEIIDAKEQFILDGFPRTKSQVDWLLMQVESGRLELPVVVNMEITDEVIRERLKKRGRLDDNDAAIAQRHSDYEAVTKPLLKYMSEKGITVFSIDADGTPAQVHERIAQALKIEK
jgi:adenylate kinase